MQSRNMIIGLVSLCLLGISSAANAYIVDGSRVSHPRLLSFAKEKLQNRGMIQRDDRGNTYLQVSDQYIHDLIRQLKKQGFETPKSGAMIDVISAEESTGLQQLAELGNMVEFKPIVFYTIVKDDREYFVLAVDAPELTSLRKKYGLSEKLENHEFKLVVGVRKLKGHDELAESNS